MTNRKDWQLGASSIIISSFGGYTDEGFATYEAAGIKYAELSVQHEGLCELDFYNNPEKMLELATAHGVTFWSFHVPFSGTLNPANLDDKANEEAMAIMEKAIRAALRIGIKTIVIHPSSEPNADDTRQIRLARSIENLRYFSKLCKESGAVLAVEDLPRTCLGNCSFDILTYLNEIPDIALCFDTNHLTMQTNEDFLDDLIEHKMHGRIRTLHVSDYDFIDERHRIPGDGVNDWATIFEKLETLDYNGVFMYEVSVPRERAPISTADVKANYEELMKGNI